MKPDLFELLPDVVLFVAVGRAKGFSRAARELQMPVSTLSRRIADFEAKLGIQLFLRSTRQVKLAEIGVRYFERCKLIVDAAETAQAELRGQKENPRGHLRLSVSQDFALTYLTPVFADLASRYPEITFELELRPRIVQTIAEGFDVAIRMGELPDSQLIGRKLTSLQHGLYAAPGYLAHVGAVKGPAALSRCECLRMQGRIEGKARWTLVRGDRVEKVSIKGRFVANSMRFLRQLATMGLGIAVIDDAIARPAVAAGSLVRVLPEWSLPPVPVYALTPSKLMTARTRIFLETLGDHLRGKGLEK